MGSGHRSIAFRQAQDCWCGARPLVRHRLCQRKPGRRCRFGALRSWGLSNSELATQWLSPTDQNTPLDDAISRIAVAKNSGDFKGILWHQGESDSRSDAVDSYKQLLLATVSNLRKAVGDSDCPVLIGQLGQFAEKAWPPERHKIDAMHQSIASEDENCGFVPSDGLTPKSDLTHFDAKSAREFGHRYFKAWQALIAE